MMQSAKKSCFVLFFPIWMNISTSINLSTTLLCYLESLVIILNRSNENGYLFYVPDLKEKHCFSLLHILFAVCFSFMSFISLRKYHFISSLYRVLIISVCLILSSTLLYLLILLVQYITLQNAKPILHSWINPTCSYFYFLYVIKFVFLTFYQDICVYIYEGFGLQFSWLAFSFYSFLALVLR